MDKPRITLKGGLYYCANSEARACGVTREVVFDLWLDAVKIRREAKENAALAALARRNRFQALQDPEGYSKRARDAEAQWRASNNFSNSGLFNAQGPMDVTPEKRECRSNLLSWLGLH